MKRKADKPISVFTVIVGAILIYMVAILLIACIKKHNKGIVVENIASEWECTVDGKKLDKKVSLKHRFTGLEVGSHIIFTKNCKEIKGIKYPALLCDFMFCNAKVFYDDELLYTYRYNKGIAAKTEATVRLEDYKKGKEFRIELKVANPRRKIYMGEAKLIEEIEEKGYRLRHNFYSVVLGGMLFVFGLLAMGIMGSLQSKNEDTRQLFWLALFATTLGLFIVAKGNLFYYIFGELVVTEIVLTVAIVIVIPSMIRIHLNMYKDNKIKKIFEVFFSILVILVGIVLIFEKTLNKYMDAVLIVGIVCLALLVGLVVLLIKDIKNAVGLSRFLDIGMFIIYGIVGGILITLICFDYIYFINIFEAGFMLIGAVLLLFVMLYYSFKIKEYMEQLSEDKVLQTLAYIDPLTGMMNRTKYEEELNSIRKEKYSICTIISFDLNYLKKINDLYGHEMGDEYIKSFAKSLRIGLEDKGFVARIGGDEFIAIIKDKIINIENVVEEIQTLLVSAMHEHKDVEISFAYGSAISKKGQKKTIDELIELSDKKMYENKRKIKEKR